MFGLGLHRLDGVHVTGPNTREAGLVPEYIDGTGHVDLRVDRLLLLPGPTTSRDALQLHADPRVRLAGAGVALRGRPGTPRESYGVVSLGGSWECSTPNGSTGSARVAGGAGNGIRVARPTSRPARPPDQWRAPTVRTRRRRRRRDSETRDRSDRASSPSSPWSTGAAGRGRRASTRSRRSTWPADRLELVVVGDGLTEPPAAAPLRARGAEVHLVDRGDADLDAGRARPRCGRGPGRIPALPRPAGPARRPTSSMP